MNELKGWISL